MRKWIEYLMSYEPARDDFFAWIQNQKTALTKTIVHEAKEGNTTKLQALGIELGIYDNIYQRFSAEFREHKNNVNRRNNQ